MAAWVRYLLRCYEKSGLEQGADDFLAKPLRPKELIARVNALSRRMGYTPSTTAANFSETYSLNIEKRIVYLDERPVNLTEREYRLAALFFSKTGELLTRPHLLELIWGMKGDISTRTVDTHVSRLRRKLELDGQHGLRLKSIYQSGYRLETCQPTGAETTCTEN
ncbi:MAG: response regulator transcription factor, partial [Halomonadaceae bacterium]